RFVDLHSVDAVGQDLPDPMPHHGVIVDEEDANHGVATVTSTVVPRRGMALMLTLAPAAAARSRMPSSPIEAGLSISAVVIPRPLSWIRIDSCFARCVSVIVTALAPACRNTFVSASWTIRNSAVL